MYMYTHTHGPADICIHTRSPRRALSCLASPAYTHTHTQTHTHTHTHTNYVCVYNTYMYICTHIRPTPSSELSRISPPYKDMCVYVCVCVCVHIYICTYAHIQHRPSAGKVYTIHTCTHTQVNMHAHVYTFAYTLHSTSLGLRCSRQRLVRQRDASPKMA